MTKKSRQKFKYLKNENSFQSEINSIFHYFKGLSVGKNYLRPWSAPLKVSENSGFEFCSHKPSKRTRNKCLIKVQKLAVLVLKSETKKRTRNKILIKSW